jgi:hypothetical protein
MTGHRPFALTTFDKAGSKPCPGVARAGQKPPALDMAPTPPSASNRRAKHLRERPRLLERIN